MVLHKAHLRDKVLNCMRAFIPTSPAVLLALDLLHFLLLFGGSDNLSWATLLLFQLLLFLRGLGATRNC